MVAFPIFKNEMHAMIKIKIFVYYYPPLDKNLVKLRKKNKLCIK